MNKIIKNSIYYKDFDRYGKLFRTVEIRESMFKKWNTKIFLNTLNGILERFSLIIRTINKRIRKGKDLGYRTTYNLCCLYNINEIIDLTELLKKFNININKDKRWNELKL